MNEKIKFPKLMAYVLGIFLSALGLTLFVKSNIGITVQTVQPYILNMAFPKLSIGTWFYLVNGFYFLLTILILKKLTFRYALSFASSVLLGYAMDLIAFILKDIQVEGLPLRILVFCASVAFISYAISLFIASGYPLIPIDSFVYEVSCKFKIPFSKAKTFFDLYGLFVALSLSFGLLHRLEGLHVGSVIMACMFGTCMGKATGVLMRHFEFTPSFFDEKLLGLMDKNLFENASL